MAISEKISKIIWGQCAAKCCICKKDLIKKNEKNHKKIVLIGEIAHIVAAKPAGPRGDSKLTQEERDSIDNLMLLCSDHHKEIDDSPDDYSIEYLIEIKNKHLKWIENKFSQPKPWKLRFSIFFYLNIPRLSEQAARLNHKVDLEYFNKNSSLHSLGYELNYLMISFENTLKNIELNAIPLDDLILHESIVGRLVSFDQKRFRTKNINVDMVDEVALMNTKFSGNWEKDPHIYTKINSFKIIMAINPRWITTTTAFVHFRPSSGHATFSGLGIITSVDYINSIITVTPFAIGLFDWMQALFSNMGNYEQA